MAGKLQPITQNDFSGGINATSSPYLVTPKQVQRAENLLLSEKGALQTRDGYTVVSTSPDQANSLLFHDNLTLNSGSTIGYAIQSGTTRNTVYKTDTTPWTTVGVLDTNYATPQVAYLTNKAVIAAGYEVPKVFDGTALTSISADVGQTRPAGAKHALFHLGSLWLWNTGASSTTLDGPSSLRASDTSNFNSWANSNQTFIAKDDGQVGMGMASFTIAEFGISPTQTLVLFKNRSTYQVTGIFGSSNFSVQQVKTDMGCIAPRSIQFVAGYGIIRLTHKGFALFNGVDDKLISEDIRPLIFGEDDIDSLNFAAIDRSWASQSQNPPLYVASCPVVGTGLTRMFIFDLVEKAWTIATFPEAFSCLSLVTSSASPIPTVRAGTASNGRILELFNGAKTDNGEPIDWSFRTRAYTAPSSMTTAFWRRMIMDLVFNPTQPVTFDTVLFGAGSAVTVTRTYRGTSTGAKWGSAVWNQFRWGGSNLVEANREIDIMRTSNSVRFDISGSGFVKIRGMEIQVRAKPLSSVRVTSN